MGSIHDSPDDEPIPVMAHPPSRTSDLSLERFLEECARDGRRHLKLDFKEEAALNHGAPLVTAIVPALAAGGVAVWLNADILPGPGRRAEPPTVPAAALLGAARLCPGAHLSLGWRVDSLAAEDAYTEDDCAAMEGLCRAYAEGSAAGSTGFVFAVAARLAYRDVAPLVHLLESISSSQLLIWTGTGEPPIPQSTMEGLRNALEASGVAHRCGFDCQVAS